MKIKEFISKRANRKTLIIISSAVALVLIVGISVIVLSSGSGRSDEYRKVMRIARKERKDLDYDRAIANYEQAIKIDPKNPDAYRELAQLYFDAGKIEKGFETIDKGIEKTADEKLKALRDEAEKAVEEGTIKPSESSTPTPTKAPDPTATPTPTPTPEPTATPTPTPTPTATPTPTPSPTPETTPEPTAEPTPEPTDEPEGPEEITPEEKLRTFVVDELGKEYGISFLGMSAFDTERGLDPTLLEGMVTVVSEDIDSDGSDELLIPVITSEKDNAVLSLNVYSLNEDGGFDKAATLKGPEITSDTDGAYVSLYEMNNGTDHLIFVKEDEDPDADPKVYSLDMEKGFEEISPDDISEDLENGTDLASVKITAGDDTRRGLIEIETGSDDITLGRRSERYDVLGIEAVSPEAQFEEALAAAETDAEDTAEDEAVPEEPADPGESEEEETVYYWKIVLDEDTASRRKDLTETIGHMNERFTYDSEYNVDDVKIIRADGEVLSFKVTYSDLNQGGTTTLYYNIDPRTGEFITRDDVFAPEEVTDEESPEDTDETVDEETPELTEEQDTDESPDDADEFEWYIDREGVVIPADDGTVREKIIFGAEDNGLTDLYGKTLVPYISPLTHELVADVTGDGSADEITVGYENGKKTVIKLMINDQTAEYTVWEKEETEDPEKQEEKSPVKISDVRGDILFTGEQYAIYVTYTTDDGEEHLAVFPIKDGEAEDAVPSDVVVDLEEDFTNPYSFVIIEKADDEEVRYLSFAGDDLLPVKDEANVIVPEEGEGKDDPGEAAEDQEKSPSDDKEEKSN